MNLTFKYLLCCLKHRTFLTSLVPSCHSESTSLAGAVSPTMCVCVHHLSKLDFEGLGQRCLLLGVSFSMHLPDICCIVSRWREVRVLLGVPLQNCSVISGSMWVLLFVPSALPSPVPSTVCFLSVVLSPSESVCVVQEAPQTPSPCPHFLYLRTGACDLGGGGRVGRGALGLRLPVGDTRGH